MVAHHFPLLHVRPATGFVNDPNGPIRIADRWHLYFQFCPSTSHTLPVLWGHASSSDLLRWTLHEPAIVPASGGPDVDGAWSGNTVEHGGRTVAYYSGFRSGRPYQTPVRAVSQDGGWSFVDPAEAMPDPTATEGVTYFRDPFVWRDGPVWWAVVGAGYTDGTPAVRRYRSADGVKWNFAGDLLRTSVAPYPGARVGSMWECPQVVQLGERTVLLVGAWSPECGIGPVYLVDGILEGNRLTQDWWRPLDYGPHFYAASVMPDPEGGGMVWGWVTEGREAAWAEADDWSGMISFPRRLTADTDGFVGLWPIAELERLRSQRLPIVQLDDGDLIASDVPPQFELSLSGLGHARRPARIELIFADDERLELTVGEFGVHLDATGSSRDPRANGVEVDMPVHTTLHGFAVRVLVDGSVAEIFASTGECATVRFYPLAPPPWSIRVRGLAASSLALWALELPTSGKEE